MYIWTHKTRSQLPERARVFENKYSEVRLPRLLVLRPRVSRPCPQIPTPTHPNSSHRYDFYGFSSRQMTIHIETPSNLQLITLFCYRLQ